MRQNISLLNLVDNDTILTGAKARLAAKSVENITLERETFNYANDAGGLSGSHSTTLIGLSATTTSVDARNVEDATKNTDASRGSDNLHMPVNHLFMKSGTFYY